MTHYFRGLTALGWMLLWLLRPVNRWGEGSSGGEGVNMVG